MKKIHDLFFETFSSNVIVGMMDDERKLYFKRWDVKFTLASSTGIDIEFFDLDGIRPGRWISALLNNRILLAPDQELNSESVMQVETTTRAYISTLLELIIKSRLPESIALEQIEINELENN